MSLAVEQDWEIDVSGRNSLFKKKELSQTIVDDVMQDYQYSDKSVKQIAEEYGLSRYMVNKLASEAENKGSLVKRKVRDNLARKLSKVNDIDWEGFNDAQMEYVTNYSKELKRHKNQKRNSGQIVLIYEKQLSVLDSPIVSEIVESRDLAGSWLEVAIADHYGSAMEDIETVTGVSKDEIVSKIRGVRVGLANRDKTLVDRLNYIIHNDSNLDHRRMASDFGFNAFKYTEAEIKGENKLVQQKRDKELLELAIGLSTEYSFDDALAVFPEFSGDSKKLDITIRNIQDRLKKGDSLLNETLWDLANNDPEIKHRKFAARFGSMYAPLEKREEYNSIALDIGRNLSTEETADEEVEEPRSHEHHYLRGFEPGVFDKNYWKEGFFWKDVKATVSDPLTYVVSGLETCIVALGLFGASLFNSPHTQKQNEVRQNEIRSSQSVLNIQDKKHFTYSNPNINLIDEEKLIRGLANSKDKKDFPSVIFEPYTLKNNN